MNGFFHLTYHVRKLRRCASKADNVCLVVDRGWMEVQHYTSDGLGKSCAFVGCAVEAPDGELNIPLHAWDQIIRLQEQNGWDLVVAAVCRDNVLSLQVLAPSSSQGPVFILQKNLGSVLAESERRAS